MRHRLRAVVTVVGLLVACGAILAAGREPRVLFEKKSEYALISVIDDGQGMRRLIFDEGMTTQSVMDIADPERLVMPYARAMMCPLAVAPKPQRMLMVGLGGATMPTFLRRNFPKAQIDIAELDPVVLEAARAHFGFKEDERMKVHIGDGRKFIETAPSRYDIIFLDAYGPHSIPHSLATKEFLEAVRAKLADGGVVVSNIWSFDSNKLYYSMLKTYQAVFPEVHVIAAPYSDNRIVIGMPAKKNLTMQTMARLARDIGPALTPKLDLSGMIWDGYEDAQRLPAMAKVLVDADRTK